MLPDKLYENTPKIKSKNFVKMERFRLVLLHVNFTMKITEMFREKTAKTQQRLFNFVVSYFNFTTKFTNNFNFLFK